MPRSVLDVVINTSKKGSGTNEAAKELKKMAAVAGSVVAALYTMKKAYDFSREGARLDAFAEASENLARQHGASMDEIIRKLQEASFHTVAESDLMLAANQAMTLGVTSNADEMAQLMTIAATRARVMGLTINQAYSDIVRGIGRKSPLILDNLGLIIEKGKEYENASELMADVIDANYDEAARAAADMADDSIIAFERAESAWKTYWENVKRDFGDSLLEILPGLTEFLEETNKMTDIMEQTGAVETYRGNMYRVGEAIYFTKEELIEYVDRLERAQDPIREMIISTEDLDEANRGLAETIDTNLTGSIERFLGQIDYMMAGGMELQTAFENIQQQYRGGLISEADAEAALRPIYLETQKLEMQLGNITADQAAENIAETLGVQLTEAEYITKRLVADIASIPGKKNFELEINATGDVWALRASGGGSKRQHGGPVAAGRPYIVGEAGPELFVPGQSGQILPNQQVTNLNMGGVSINNGMDQMAFEEMLRSIGG